MQSSSIVNSWIMWWIVCPKFFWWHFHFRTKCFLNVHCLKIVMIVVFELDQLTSTIFFMKKFNESSYSQAVLSLIHLVMRRPHSMEDSCSFSSWLCANCATAAFLFLILSKSGENETSFENVISPKSSVKWISFLSDLWLSRLLWLSNSLLSKNHISISFDYIDMLKFALISRINPEFPRAGKICSVVSGGWIVVQRECRTRRRLNAIVKNCVSMTQDIRRIKAPLQFTGRQ